jgi:predicted metal-dependent hydrolase
LVSKAVTARREVASGEVFLGSRPIPYRIIRSPRARLIRLRMVGDGVVEVVVPPRVQVPPVEELLQSKQRWILRQLDSFNALLPARPDHVDYLGKEYRVLLTRIDGPTGWISLHDGELRVELPRGVDVNPIIQTFLRKQARAVLIDRVRIWSEAMEVLPGRISVRDQRTRWGSCSTNGGLNFSWRLVMAPLPVLDYVVIHELMHLREMNHSKQFWDGVARHCPEYQQHLAWLKDNGAKLARPLMIDDAELT